MSKQLNINKSATFLYFNQWSLTKTVLCTAAIKRTCIWCLLRPRHWHTGHMGEDDTMWLWTLLPLEQWGWTLQCTRQVIPAKVHTFSTGTQQWRSHPLCKSMPDADFYLCIRSCLYCWWPCYCVFLWRQKMIMYELSFLNSNLSIQIPLQCWPFVVNERVQSHSLGSCSLKGSPSLL